MKKIFLFGFMVLLLSYLAIAEGEVIVSEYHDIVDHCIIIEKANDQLTSKAYSPELNIESFLKGFNINNPTIDRITTTATLKPVYKYQQVKVDCPELVNETPDPKKECYDMEKVQVGTKTVYTDVLEAKPVLVDTQAKKTSLNTDFNIPAMTTVKYRVCWKTPILTTPEGFGSIGGYSINPANWWNISFGRRINITIVGDSNDHKDYACNFTIKTTQWIDNGWLQSDGDDFRIIDPVTNTSYEWSNSTNLYDSEEVNTTIWFLCNMTANQNLTRTVYFNNTQITTSTWTEQNKIRGLQRFNDTVYLVRHENTTGIYEEVVGTGPSAGAGVEWVFNSSCMFDNCVRMDGNNNYYAFNDNALYDMNGSYSIDFWFKLISQAEDSHIISKRDQTDIGGDRIPFQVDFIEVGGWGYEGMYFNYRDKESGAYYGQTCLRDYISNEWYHVAIVHNEQDDTCKWYVNGALNCSIADTTSSGTNDVIVATGCIDDTCGTKRAHYYLQGQRLTNRTITSLEINDSARLYTFSYISHGIEEPATYKEAVVVHDIPADLATYPQAPVSLYCNSSVIGATTLQNVSLFLFNDTGLYYSNNTVISGNTSRNSWNFSSLPEGVYYWGCEVWTVDDLGDDSGNRTFWIDDSPPTINLQSNNEFNIKNHSTRNHFDNTLYLNISFEDDLINITGFTVNITRGGTSYHSEVNTTNALNHSLEQEIDVTTWPVGLYDVLLIANTGVWSTTEQYTTRRGNYSINKPDAWSGQNVTFTLNLTKNSDELWQTDFIYNGVTSSVTHTTEYSDHYLFSKVMTAGSTGTGNFTWNITGLIGVSPTWDLVSLSVSGNHTIYDYSIDNCSTNTFKTLMAKIFNENSPTVGMNATLEAIIDYWINDPLTGKNFSTIFAYNDTVYFCVLNHAPIFADIYLKFNTTNGSTHRYYNINTTLTNTTQQNVSLYNFNVMTGLSSLRLTVREKATYNYFSGIIGILQRFYVSENVWRTVQMDQSGDYGLQVFDIYEDDTDYRLIFQDLNNSVLKQTNSMKFDCDSSLCELTVLLDPSEATSRAHGLSVSYTYNNNTGNITATWSNIYTEESTVTMLVRREVSSGTIYICNTTQTGTSGTIICDVSAYSGVVHLLIEGTGSANTIKVSEWIDLATTKLGSLLGNAEGGFWALGLMVTITLFGAILSPVLALIMSIFSLVIIYVMGLFTPITLTFVVIASILGVIIGLKIKH